MYLSLGQSVLLPNREIVGIFDLDNTTWSHRTRQFLDRVEEEGRVIFVGEDLPRSFVLCEMEGGEEVVFLSQINAQTLARRAAAPLLQGIEGLGNK